LNNDGSKMANDYLDIMKLGNEVMIASNSGAITQCLIDELNTLYEPDPEKPNHLRRYSAAGKIDRGVLNDGIYIIKEVISGNEM
jgi:hypothetical protein